MIRGCTLEGGSEGLRFYLRPDYNKLGDFEVRDALLDTDIALYNVAYIRVCTGLEERRHSNFLLAWSLSRRSHRSVFV